VKRIQATTPFVDDVAAAKQPYLKVLCIPIYFDDENSVVFEFATIPSG
jgi:hypothetical protein